MINPISAPLAGLQVFTGKLQNTANNIANSNTDSYKTKQAAIVENSVGLPSLNITVDNLPGPRVQESDGLIRETSNADLSREIPSMVVAKRGYEANLKVLETHCDMLKSLLDVTA
ncbi:MAG: flagellar hook protein FlgE [Syntrophorhabdus sp. PtaU1.Bin153]|nr:MAG: flagellar hook protein FlgE [Syntrophorhabdus sp. PtaU1.Bin153]